jgi:hypothetical protein
MSCSLPPTEERFIKNRCYLEKELREIHALKTRSGFLSRLQLDRAKQVVELIKKLESSFPLLAKRYQPTNRRLLDLRRLD